MSVLNDYGKYKRYVKKEEGYQLCSQWTSANTLHFDDGKTAQEKLGAIDGITDSLTSTSSNVALSANSGKSLQDQITQLNTHTGRIGKLLFSRTYSDAFSEGSIEVPGICEYKTFIGLLKAAMISPMIGILTGGIEANDTIVFTGSIITADTNAAAARTTLGVSGDTLTFKKGCGVIAIYGLF